ncbi:Hypothetical protein OINT_2001478 [Brucella intermedia LMG 3301]|uniref:Uncharacterized protein n=1 Tax=Brucella intermedia LMG 3301 TaxID=641118 RepID=C4WPE5_9HYPH|nr:Hypothetical protein OINT_2001478 [Brucella intermedia LMG 3301]
MILSCNSVQAIVSMTDNLIGQLELTDIEDAYRTDD